MHYIMKYLQKKTSRHDAIFLRIIKIDYKYPHLGYLETPNVVTVHLFPINTFLKIQLDIKIICLYTKTRTLFMF